jgi:signal transduction histidine kinase
MTGGIFAAVRTPQVVIKDLPQIICTSQLSYYVDTSRKLSFNDIRFKSFSTQSDLFLKAIDEYSQRANYWVGFSLENTDSIPAAAYLDAGDFGSIEVYEVHQNKIIIHKGGTGLKKDTRVPYPELHTIKLTIPPQTEIQYFILMSSNADDDLDFQGIDLSSKKVLYDAYYQDYHENNIFRFLQIFFLGFMFSQMLYISFSRVIGIKRREYLFYLFYLILVTGYYAVRYNNVIDIYWPLEYYPQIRIYLKSILLALPYLFYLKFVRYILNVKELDKRIYDRIIRLEYFVGIYVFVDTSLRLFLPNVVLLNEILMITILGIFLYVLTLIAGLMKYRRLLVNLVLTGSLIAGLGEAIGVVITLLQYMIGMLQVEWNSLISGQIGIVVETIIFTTSLSMKTRMMEREQIEDQKKLIEQLEENESLRQKMEKIRNKIAQDLHDDIGSGLTRIAILADVAIRQSEVKQVSSSEGNDVQSPESKESLPTHDLMQRIGSNARELIGSMSDVIWSMDSKNFTVSDLVVRFRSFAYEMCEAKGINLQFETDADLETLQLDPVIMRDLLIMTKEALHNSVKHSACKNLRIGIKLKSKEMYLLISDDGCGFSIDNNLPGHGLGNMRTRAEKLGGKYSLRSSPGDGTTIEIAVPIGT